MDVLIFPGEVGMGDVSCSLHIKMKMDLPMAHPPLNSWSNRTHLQ